jgi:DNA polymerase-3 subunit alpha (Gram-positive type)
MIDAKYEDIVKLEYEPYVVFDVETTGLDAKENNSIIEIGAVKVRKGKIIDTFSYLINPGFKLSKTITDITGITDVMLKDAESERKIVDMFLYWIGDLPLIAHNASFDISFLRSACKKYDFNDVENKVIDTLELSRQLKPFERRHTLDSVMKMYNVDYDYKCCHRADYDAKKTGEVFRKMLEVILKK